MTSGRKRSRRKKFFAILALCVLAALLAALLLASFLPPSMAATGFRAQAQAQAEHGTGWVPAPPGEYRQYGPGTTGRQFKAVVDLSAQLPPIGDQGNLDSCVSWALGYYYKGWQEGREHTGWDLTQAKYEYSPAFMYNQCNGGSDDGMSFAGSGGGFALLEEKGSTDLQEMPYDDTDFTTQPTADQLQAALPYRIPDNWSYFWMRGDPQTPPLGSPTGYVTPNDIAPLKALLDAGEPLVIGTSLYSDFPGLGGAPTPYYDKALSAVYEAGHALCIVGYNDNAYPAGADDDHKGGFKAVNSWGPGWNGASAGYIYLSYDFMKHYVQEAWQMDDKVPDTAHVDSVTPDHGGSGTSVRIDGYNFGTDRRNYKVQIDGADATINSWNDARIVAITPPTTTTGDLVVYDWDGVASNPTPFWAPPTLTGLSTATGNVGDTITLTGTNFGDSRETGCYVSFGSDQVTAYGSWSDASIQCEVPAAAAGLLQVTVTTPGGITLGRNFSVIPTLDAIGPSEGPPGTEVTIQGTGFGNDRGTSCVEFEAVQATLYNAWSDDEIKCLVPTDTPGIKPVRVHTTGGDSVPLDFVLGLPSATWYLAEGSTGGGMETWVLVQNPEVAEVTVSLTLMTDTGEQKPAALQNVVIGGKSRMTFNLNNFVTTYDVSTRVEASNNVVCERAMYGNGRAWAHESIGATSTSSTWYLAEGSTDGGMETWVLVQNPNDTGVTVTLELQDVTTGGAVISDVPIGPKSRTSFNLGDSLVTYSVSTVVTSQGGNVVCERAMYGNGRAWAHDSVGAKTPAFIWYLAEGCTAGGFETWVLVQNPGAVPVSVDLELQTDQGQLAPAQLQGVIIAPETRQSFNLGDYVTTYDVSTMVTSTGGGVVSERAVYGGNRGWAHESIGATATASTWNMAEGCTSGGMETWILVQNPGAGEVTVSLTLMTDNGPVYPPGLTGVTIAGNSRRSFNLGLYAITYNVSTRVDSEGGAVVCERAMYGGKRTWAHDSVGYAP